MVKFGVPVVCESMGLEDQTAQFKQAAKLATSLPIADCQQQDLLRLYGLYKTAVVGALTGSKPRYGRSV